MVATVLEYSLDDNCVPTGKLAKGTTTESNATPLQHQPVLLCGKKEVGWAVQAVSGTTDFVIVFCFFTIDSLMIISQIFAVWHRKKHVFTFFLPCPKMSKMTDK